MLTPTRLPQLSSFGDSRTVFSSSRKGVVRRFWWAFLALIVAISVGGFRAYGIAIDWWNTEIYLKKQAVEIDTTDPVFTNALVQWIKQKTVGIPNTNPEMLTEIVATAFKESGIRQVDPFLTLAIIATESQFNYMATSPAGAKGLMQVIPYWHKDKISAVEVYNPTSNVKAGTMILKQYLDSSNGDVHKALLKYNGSSEIPGANYDAKVLRIRSELSRFVELHIRKTYAKRS